jgi:two-component system response regulator AtoC
MAPVPTIRVLVVSPAQRGRRLELQGLERQPGLSLIQVESVARALDAVDAQGVDLVLVDGDALGSEAEVLLAAVHERWWDLPLLLVASAASPEACARALAAGASELITTPSLEVLALAVERARATLARSRARPATAPLLGGALLGRSPVMTRIAELIAQIGPSSASVLVRGESGTGKELVARALHAASLATERPFIKIDCTSLPDNLLESELFGYEKGAFTGAAARKIGRVELAQGGTLFLDEIGELTLPTQAKLLRLLQDREFERLGSTHTIQVNVRVIAATHRDLENMVERGQFRQDLFYRLNVVPLWLPPLRARRADIEQLAVHFSGQAAAKNARGPVRLAPEALRLLSRQRWPGNVRQLQNFVERLVVLARGEEIDAADVQAGMDQPMVFQTETGSDQSGAPARGNDPTREPAARPDNVHLSQALRDAERQALLNALQQAKGNRSLAARLLGISRSTFYSKLEEHGLP